MLKNIGDDTTLPSTWPAKWIFSLQLSNQNFNAIIKYTEFYLAATLCKHPCKKTFKSKHLGLTFASLCSIHAGKQDVVVVCPVDPLVGIINCEGGGVIDFFVNDNHLSSSIHADASDVRRLTTVHPEHVASQRNEESKRIDPIFSLLWNQSVTINSSHVERYRDVLLGLLCLPCLRVQSEIRGISETRTDQDCRI